MNLEIERFVNSPISSNCYILFSKDNKRAAIIDPGTHDCDEVLKFLTTRNLNLDFIILTHEHFDHISGVSKLKLYYDAKIVSHKKCAENIIDRKRNLSIFFDQVGFATPPADLIFDQKTYCLQWYDRCFFKFYHMPGHSDGSISILIDKYLFVGDTLIKEEKTITKLPGGNFKKLKSSLDQISGIMENKNIKIFPGHGEEFYLVDEHIKIALYGW